MPAWTAESIKGLRPWMDVLNPQHLGFAPTQARAVSKHPGEKDERSSVPIGFGVQTRLEALKLIFGDQIG
jgi:spore cortex formation protein SpoVR/YcgB (stage V sporulation)